MLARTVKSVKAHAYKYGIMGWFFSSFFFAWFRRKLTVYGAVTMVATNTKTTVNLV